jgi:hypothetical protein
MRLHHCIGLSLQQQPSSSLPHLQSIAIIFAKSLQMTLLPSQQVKFFVTCLLIVFVNSPNSSLARIAFRRKTFVKLQTSKNWLN